MSWGRVLGACPEDERGLGFHVVHGSHPAHRQHPPQAHPALGCRGQRGGPASHLLLCPQTPRCHRSGLALPGIRHLLEGGQFASGTHYNKETHSSPPPSRQPASRPLVLADPQGHPRAHAQPFPVLSFLRWVGRPVSLAALTPSPGGAHTNSQGQGQVGVPSLITFPKAPAPLSPAPP